MSNSSYSAVGKKQHNGSPAAMAAKGGRTVLAAAGTRHTAGRYLSVKVRLEDEERMQWALFALTDSLGLVTKSEEVFWDVPQGQLKLRLLHVGSDIGELVSTRHSQQGVPPSHFCETSTSPVHGAGQLRHTLSLAIGELAVIRKRRRTFSWQPTVKTGPVHFHLDCLDGLGPFLDIEMHPGTDESDSQVLARAEELLKRLEVPRRLLLVHSYLKLFLKETEKRADSDESESAFSDMSIP